MAMMLVVAAPGQAQARYAAIVIDLETGKVLYSRNADTRNYPASLTKMMTLYMTFEALEEGRLSLHQRLPVSRRAQGMTPSKLGLRVGQTITVENAILALVTKSANDAAVVLAEALGDTEWQFALEMTDKARELGMHRTTFRNASGLPNRRQLSTARDMARLGQALMRDFPQYYHYFSTERFSYNGRTYGNHNNLLDHYRGTDGIKTGYIRASGFNLVASVKRHGRRLIAVVFGGRTARSRDQHIMKLLDQGFERARHLKPIPVVSPPPKKPVDAIRVASGEPAPEPEPEPKAVAAATPGTPAPDSKPIDDLIARIADEQPEAMGDASAAMASAASAGGVPLPPAIERPQEVKVAARQLALAQGQYAVQVGAYHQFKPARAAATRAVQQVPQLLANSEMLVSRARNSQGQIYRARLAGLARARAEQACRLLEAAGTDCLVVQHRGGVEIASNSDRRS